MRIDSRQSSGGLIEGKDSRVMESWGTADAGMGEKARNLFCVVGVLLQCSE